MRAFDMSNMIIVYTGDEWQHTIAPCSRVAIPLLERNEKIVSWLRPTHGSVKDEIPAILYKGRFYTLSLRMLKAIYRHIRLRKGFKNVEVMDGVKKLRIPPVLLREKIRTQSRFEVLGQCVCHVSLYNYLFKLVAHFPLCAGYAQTGEAYSSRRTCAARTR